MARTTGFKEGDSSCLKTARMMAWTAIRNHLPEQVKMQEVTTQIKTYPNKKQWTRLDALFQQWQVCRGKLNDVYIMQDGDIVAQVDPTKSLK